MDRQASLLTFLLCAGVIFWLYQNTELSNCYERDPHLLFYHEKKPEQNLSDLIGLGKVILQTESYIESTSTQQRLYDLQFSTNIVNPLRYELKYSDKEQERLSAWPIADQTLCLKQLDWIVDQLRLHPNCTFELGEHARQLSHLLDSFGKPSSRLLEGSVNWLGSYTECTRVSLEQNGAKVNTRYCIARARPNWWPTEEIVYPPTGIHIAVCLPETCDTNSFSHSQQHRQLIELLARHELPELYKNGLQFESLFCLPDERSPIRRLPLSGRIYLWLVGGWLAFVLIASVADEIFLKREMSHEQSKQTNGNKKQTEVEQLGFIRVICSSVSVRNSFKEFGTNRFREADRKGVRVRVDLGAINFIKVMLALVIVVSHAEFIGMINVSKLAYLVELATSNLVSVTLSIALLVDTFFVIAGILGAYTILRKFTVNQLANPLVWLTINTNVFIRIAPMYMLVYWYSQFVSVYTAAGPTWDYGVSDKSFKGQCVREDWWKSLPHWSNSGKFPAPICLPPGWFIACYAQISCLLPPLIYILTKLPDHLSRFVLTSYLSIASVLSLSYTLYNQTSVPAEAFTVYGGFILGMAHSIGYTSTLGRLASVAIGVLAGYFLHQYKEGKLSEWPRWINSGLSQLTVALLHLLIVFLPLVGKLVYQMTGEIASLGQIVTGNAVVSILWPLFNAIAIVQMCTINNHQPLVRFFSHSFWHSFNKLTFIMYLVHWEIEFVSVSASEGGQILGYLIEIVRLGIYGIVFSIVVSFFLHILVETPLTRLIMTVISYPIQSASRPRTATANGQRKNSTLGSQLNSNGRSSTLG